MRSAWYGIARKEHVTEGDCETIRTAFENEGFSYQLEKVSTKKTKPVTAKGAKKSAAGVKGGRNAKPEKKRARS